MAVRAHCHSMHREKAMSSNIRTSVSDSIYLQLRRRILDLSYQPGHELNVNELTEQMQVSRSPVRDALMRLSADQLVDIFPQRGTRVSLLDLAQVEEERFIRTSLEQAAVGKFVVRWTDADLAAMDAAVVQQEIARRERAYDLFLQWDDTFHGVIFQATGHGRSWDLIQGQCGNYHRIRMLSFSDEGVSESVVTQHRDLLAALRNRDVATVMEIEHSHVSKLLAESRWMMEKYPSYFTQAMA